MDDRTRSRRVAGLAALALGLLVPATACTAEEAAPAAEPVEATAQHGADAPPDGPLPTPFTAEEIRDAFRPGLEIRFYSKGRDEPRELSSMRVLEADADGVRIAQASLDDDGEVVGEPQVTRSRWTELRDHASFPAATTARAKLRRPTPLGELDGWLYTVRDRDRGTVSEFFFAEALPGPPVTLVVRSLAEREVLREYLQVGRSDRPAGSPQ